MKEIDDKMFDEILSNTSSQYFFYKPDTGEIVLEFLTGITKVEPGDVGLDDRVWEPPITDSEGNPKIDPFTKEPREPWPKFEIKAKVTGKDRDGAQLKEAERIYSLGGENGSQLKSLVRSVKDQGFTNKDLPGTKWSFYGDKGAKYWNWTIKYLGEGETSTSLPPKEITTEDGIDYKKISEALSMKKDQGSNKIAKNDMIVYLAFVLNKSSEEVKDIIPKLVAKNMVKEDNDSILI